MLLFSKKISQISINGSDFWSHPKMSGFLPKNVRDPRSQDPDFLELWALSTKQRRNSNSEGSLFNMYWSNPQA
jgi:hypothetical protein